MRVGVVGAGTIGLLSGLSLVNSAPMSRIAARHDTQAAAAEQLGLAVDAPRNCDVVFEAAGTPTGFDDAVKRARRGSGTVVLVSTTWEPISVSFLNAQMREVTLVPAFVYGEAHDEREFDTAVSILATRPDIPDALITHRYGLDEAPEAFRWPPIGPSGAIKVVLHP